MVEPIPPDGTEISVGGMPYTIKWVPRLQNHDHQSLWGQHDSAAQLILMEPGHAPYVTRVYLWHELIHAVCETRGQKHPKDGLIDALSYGFVELLENNPWLRTIT